MTKFTLGVYGIYCAPKNSPAPTFDLGAMFDPNYEYSLLRYWRDVTAGTREIDATVHDWVNIGTSQSDIDKLEATADPEHSRSVGATRAAEYANAHFPKSPPSNFDGVVIFATTTSVTGQLDTPSAAGGATAIDIDNKRRPAAYLNLGAAFNFYAHEIGHVLGYDHSSGPLHSVDQWGTYDDPVDCMSSARYGATDPTFRIPDADRRFAHPLLWGDDAFNAGAGPALSPAQLWRYSASPNGMDDFTAPDMPWVRKLAPGAPPTLIKLYRAGTPMLDMPWPLDDVAYCTLVAIPSPDADPYWTTFEYRPALGWDRGLGHGPGLVDPALQRPPAGVVVHRILRDDGAPNDGPVDRVNYRHTVTVPGGDQDWQDWTDGRTAVRVIDHSPDAVLILVGSRLPKVHEVKLTTDPKVVDPLVLPGEMVNVSGVGPRCGTAKFRLQHRETGSEVTASAEYAGFTSPVLRWTVNGETIPFWLDPTATAPAEFQLTIAVPVKVPVSYNVSQTITKPIDLVVRVDGYQAIITAPRGDGTWNMSVSVEVAEAAQHPVALATATADETLTTFALTLPIAVVAAQGACLATIADEIRQLPPDKLDIVNPKYLLDYVKDHEFTELGPVFKSLFELSVVMPSAASGLIADVAEQLDLQTGDIRRIGLALAELETAAPNVGTEVST